MAAAPHGPPAGVAETHISVVFFVGDRALKLKKPVRFGFLDFSTRALRLEACRREVEVNRRLAPDVYLGVSDVTDVDGEVCDHLVVMRRMPAERRLATLVAEGAPGLGAGIDALAAQVADFHRHARRGPEVDEAGGPDALARVWEDGFAEVAAHVGDVLDADVEARVEARSRAWLAGRRALLDERVAEGWVRDGHGDLQADDVFLLDDGPRVLDAIEFDDRLRCADVVADAAFLAMDLERLGAPDLADRFVAAWARALQVPVPAGLLDHHVAQRAHVRAKVAVLRWAQADPDTEAADQAARQARDLLAICDRHLDRARVRLVLVGGAPGTGTTTVARALADRTGWTVLRTDEVRRDLADGGDRYAPDQVDATYDALLDRARPLLARGETVVLDASWRRERHRAAARALARDAVAEVVELRTVAPVSVAQDRVARRLGAGTDVSEATPEVARTLADEFEAWPEAVELDTSGAAPAGQPAPTAAAGAFEAAGLTPEGTLP